MFKCTECGEVFCEPDSWAESHGEILGGCPNCGGHFEEAYKCEICGEWYTEDELCEGVCDECVNDYSAYEDCKGAFDGETTEVNIDLLAAALLDEATINDILRKYIEERMPTANVVDALDEKELFCEKIKDFIGGN